MRNSFLSLLTVTALAFAPAAMAADTNDFVKNASIAGKFEIDSSKLALTKSKNADVKAFAQQMIKDHTKASNKLKSDVKKAKVDKSNLQDKLDDKHQALMDELNKDENGAAFDKDYISKQVDAHDEAVSLFSDYSKDGDNAVLKDFAAKTLPTLKMHQEHVQKLQEAVK